MKLVKLEIETKSKKIIQVEWDGEKIHVDGVLDQVSHNEEIFSKKIFHDINLYLEGKKI